MTSSSPRSETPKSSVEDDLRDSLQDLAALVAATMTMEQLLDQVAISARLAIPGADGVGVTLLRLTQRGNQVESMAATDDFVRAVDAVQYEIVDEGPCITAAAERTVISSGSIGADRRWPRFGPRIARQGVHSVLSLPMLLPEGTVVGAVNAYSRTREAFDSDAASIGLLFARPAAIAVHNAHVLSQARTRAAELQHAMATRAIIDQAIGVLRSRMGGSSDEAFSRLRVISQNENVKLSAVAERIVDEAVRRARARSAPGH